MISNKRIGLPRVGPITSPAAAPANVTAPQRDEPSHQPGSPVQVNFHADNRETLEAIGRQNGNIDKFNAILNKLVDRIGSGTCTVTVTGWTPEGRIKTLKVTKE